MSEDIKYGLLFLGMGVLSLYIGLSWRRPNWGGGKVHKYGAIIMGGFCVLIAILSFLGLL